MNLLRYTVVEANGAVSFVYDGAVLGALLRACAEAPSTTDAFLDIIARRDPRLREHLACGLAVFDEHNSPGNYTSIHGAIAHFAPEEWPVFRVVDDVTREASLRPTRAGAIVFNLAERRIVQITNTYAEIHDMGLWVRRLQRAGWQIVP